MSEKRFEISRDKYFIFDNAEDDFLDLEDIVIVLNEQQDTIQSLEEDIVEICDDHQSYIEMDSETHSKLNNKIYMQRRKIFRLEKENEKLNNELEKLQIELKELNRKYNAFYDMTNERLSEMSFDYLIQPYKDRNMKLEDDLLFQKEMKKMLEQEIERLTEENENLRKQMKSIKTTMDATSDYNAYLQSEVKDLKKENEKLKNELKKEKLLLEYSDSMYGADLIVNVRFTNGEWKADVSVIDNE